MTPHPPSWYPDPYGGGGNRWWDGARWTEHVEPSAIDAHGIQSPVKVPRPQPRLIRSPKDAEVIAAEWMRWYGFSDAVVTQASGDGGFDVDSSAAVAQVKAHMTPIGRPALQQLHGVAASQGKQAVFFSLMAYTREGLAWADSVKMALFRFNHAGEAEPVNGCAMVLDQHGGNHLSNTMTPVHRNLSAQQQQVAPAVPTLRCFAVGRPDDYFLGMAAKARQGGFAKETLLWVAHAWLPVIAIDVNYTMIQRRREIHNSRSLLFDPLDGRQHIPTTALNFSSLPATTPIMPARVRGATLIKAMLKEFRAYDRVKSPEARQRHSAILNRYGIPPAANSISLHEAEAIMVPIVAACYQGKSGHRCTVWDAATGAPSASLSSGVTQNLSWAGAAILERGQRIG